MHMSYSTVVVVHMGRSMDIDVGKKKRRRVKQTQPLRERLLKAASQARSAAQKLPHGAEQTKLLRRAREAEAIIQLEQWLSKPLPSGRRPGVALAITEPGAPNRTPPRRA